MKTARTTVGGNKIPLGTIVEALPPTATLEQCEKAANMLFYDMFDKPRHIPLLTRCEAMMGPGRAVGLSMAAQVFPAEISMEYCARPEDIDYFFALLRVHPLTLKPEAQATAGDRAVMHGITFSAQDGGLDGLRKALNSAIAIRDSARTREPYKPTLSQSIYNAIGPCRGE